MAIPTDLAPDLLYWWDAEQQPESDGAGVHVFLDQSSNGFDGTSMAGDPTMRFDAIAGKKGIEWVGGESFTLAASQVLSEYTYFFVGKTTKTSELTMLVYAGGGNGIFFHPNGSFREFTAKSQTGGNVTSSVSSMPDDWCVLTVRCSSTVSALYCNGVLMGEQILAGLSSVSGTPTQDFIYNLGFIYSLIGFVKEVFVFSRALTDMEMAAQTARILTELSLQPKGLIVIDGNSIANDILIDGAYTYRNTYDVVSVSVGGQTNTAIAADLSAQVLPLFDASRPKCIYICWEMSNEYNYPVYQGILDDCKAAGFYTVAVTVLARNGYDDATREAQNDLIRGGAHDALADPAIRPEFDEESDTANTTYYDGLGIHPSATGGALTTLDGEAAIAVVDALDPPDVGSITSVTIDPTSATLYGYETQQFTVDVEGEGPFSSVVDWTTNLGSITSDGLFTAPGGRASGAQTATVTVTSHQDGTKSDSATVTIPAHTAGGGGGGINGSSILGML